MFSAMSLVLCLMVAGASAQVTTFQGACPVVTVQQNFNVAQYLGKWFDFKHYPIYFQADGTCITATYADNNNGSVSVLNSQYNTASKSQVTILGYAVPNASGEGKLLVHFPTVGPFGSDYWVLGTDYTSYSVVWSCRYMPATNQNYQSAWVLTRERVPSTATLAAAEVVLTANKVSLAEFQLTDHSSCPGDAGFTESVPQIPYVRPTCVP